MICWALKRLFGINRYQFCLSRQRGWVKTWAFWAHVRPAVCSGRTKARFNGRILFFRLRTRQRGYLLSVYNSGDCRVVAKWFLPYGWTFGFKMNIEAEVHGNECHWGTYIDDWGRWWFRGDDYEILD